MPAKPARVRAAGMLVIVRDQLDAGNPRSFLLMRHIDRWDLPKGHCDGDESFREAAIRELREETGLKQKQYEIDREFRFDLHYPVRSRRYGKHPVDKHVRYFIAWTNAEHSITLTEHIEFQWQRWQPPHHIQSETIDPLLAAVQEYLRC